MCSYWNKLPVSAAKTSPILCLVRGREMSHHRKDSRAITRVSLTCGQNDNWRCEDVFFFHFYRHANSDGETFCPDWMGSAKSMGYDHKSDTNRWVPSPQTGNIIERNIIAERKMHFWFHRFIFHNLRIVSIIPNEPGNCFFILKKIFVIYFLCKDCIYHSRANSGGETLHLDWMGLWVK